MAICTIGASTSLTSVPSQRSADRAIDTLPGSTIVASSSHANGVTPPAELTTTGAESELRLGGASLCPLPWSARATAGMSAIAS